MSKNWLNGWPMIGNRSVLMGTGVHCAGCGKFEGLTCVAFDNDTVFPTEPPSWPFEESTCPICEGIQRVTSLEVEQPKDKLAERQGLHTRISELESKLDKREQEALADEDRYHNALARIDELERRLELYAKAGDGSDIKMEIGDCDGIGCRDETIKILQAQVDRYRYLIERDITYDVACKDCEHGLNFSTAICPICTEKEVRKWTLLHQERRFERDKLQWKLNDIARVLDRLNKNEITNERDALAQIEQLMEQPK